MPGVNGATPVENLSRSLVATHWPAVAVTRSSGVVSVHSCPYCGARRKTIGGHYDHVLDEHAEAVLARWIDEHGVTPIRSGQRTLQGAIACD